jgi:predicted DNA-binding transcriptional regulator YafY
MNLFDRIYALHKELSSARRPVSKKSLEERLECSPATIKRIIRDMRLYLDAPIEYDREYNGYVYADAPEARFELPGLWFNESEIVSLLVMEQLLESTQPGLLERELAPIRKRLEDILQGQQLGTGELARRVKVIRASARPAGEHFRTVAGALAARRRLEIGYHGRIRDALDTREISPQRLTYYRDNWYLDAWCHRAEGLRTFALDRIQAARSLDGAAHELPEASLDDELGSSYGIFAGKPAATAVLRFTPEAARWVADETWHPDQTSAWLADGRYELCVPYARAEELLRDILAHGPNVEVAGPDALREAVAERLARAAGQYDH